MAKMGPIIFGLGAAALLLRRKSGSGTAPPVDSGGFGGTDPGGSSDCHILAGIWAPARSAADSPLSEITSNQRLAILPLTPEAFKEADLFLQDYYQAGHEGDLLDPDVVVFRAEQHLTGDMDCNWGKPSQWTPRMKQVHQALNVLVSEGTKEGGIYAPFMGG